MKVVVELRARFESEIFECPVTFIATGDENSDVFVSAIGPGAHAEPKAGLFKRTRYSGFEFGVLVRAATAEQGTRNSGMSGPLVKHGPSDGVPAASAGRARIRSYLSSPGP